MSETVNIWEKPTAKEIYMLAGWRQWADAGSISSGLPLYLVQDRQARRIGEMNPDGFYLFQIPGTHDMVRPMVKFEDGFPVMLETRRNEFFFTGDDERGTVIFLGDEPQIDIERYVAGLLQAAQEIDDAAIGVIKTAEQQQILHESVVAAERSLELANTLYQEGYAGFQRVLDFKKTIGRT